MARKIISTWHKDDDQVDLPFDCSWAPVTRPLIMPSDHPLIIEKLASGLFGMILEQASAG